VAIRRTLVGAGALAATLTLAIGGNALAAQTPADTNPGVDTTFAAVGSDTADDVMQGLSSALTDATGPIISSYRAVPPAGATTAITTKTAANCANVTRPNGSGAGVNALSQSIQGLGGLTGCFDIARSSNNSAPTQATPAGALTYLPYAVDSVSYATIAGTSIVKNANLALLKTIFTKNGVPGTADCGGISKWSPLIPQAGSGTRNFWAGLMGVSSANRGTIEETRAATVAADPTQWGSCVRDRIGQVGTDQTTGTPIQEHDGTVLTTAGSIVPFSTAQWISQGAQVIGDKRGGRSVLNAIDFDDAGGNNSVSPFVLQQNFKGITTANTAARGIYNVVETARITPGNAKFDQRLSTLLVGPTSTLCADTNAKNLIQRFGFDLPPLTAPVGVETCGSNAITRP